MVSELIGQSQVGPIEKIPNLKKRQRSIYYRPVKKEDGTVDWMPTQLLPSDMQGRETYLSKGFRLSPPKATDTVTSDEGTANDQENENLRAENLKLKQQLQMAKAREARGTKKG